MLSKIDEVLGNVSPLCRNLYHDVVAVLVSCSGLDSLVSRNAEVVTCTVELNLVLLYHVCLVWSLILHLNYYAIRAWFFRGIFTA